MLIAVILLSKGRDVPQLELLRGGEGRLELLAMQQFQSALAAAQKLKLGNIPAFTQQYNSDQHHFAAARTPNDFVAISNDAATALKALSLLQASSAQLAQFNA